MYTRAAKFDNYLASTGNGDIFQKKVFDDFIMYHGHFKLPGSQGFMHIYFDYSMYNSIKAGVAEISNPSKQSELLSFINYLNSKYKNYCFVIHEGCIEANTCIISPNERYRPEMTLELTITLMNDVQKIYPEFMKIMWS